MNLLCPICQKMLTVEEKFAGQMMKCPLCMGTFTVPGLPSAPSVPPVPAAPAAPAAPPGVSPVLAGVDPAPAAFGAGPAPAVGPLPASPSSAPPVSASLPPSTAGYQKVFSVPLNPQVLQFFAPVAVVLIFVLQFFPWVGIYPGGVPVTTHSAWGATFGSDQIDETDLARYFAFTTEADLGKNKDKEDKEKIKDNRPRFSFLMFLYLVLSLLTLVLTVASFVLPFVRVRLPPAVEKLWPWRWGIVAAANLLTFLFLSLQLFTSFSLEVSADEWAQEQEKRRELGRKEQDKPVPQRQLLVEKGRDRQTARTTWLRWVVVLHLLAIASSALMFWIGQRVNRPLPRIDVLW